MPDYDPGLDAWVPWGDPDREAWQVQRGTDWITAGALIGLFLMVLAVLLSAGWLLIR